MTASKDQPPSFDQQVGRAIKAGREMHGWSQRALADLLNEAGWSVNATALPSIENGTRSIRVAQLEIVAQVMGLSLPGFLAISQSAAAWYAEQLTEAMKSASEQLARVIEYRSMLDGLEPDEGEREAVVAAQEPTLSSQVTQVLVRAIDSANAGLPSASPRLDGFRFSLRADPEVALERIS